MNANILRTWAELGDKLRASQSKQRPTWHALSRFIEVARPKLKADGRKLHDLLEESRRQLDPFGEPFDLDFGMHRWLAEDREEAYSDWLQWIVEQINSPVLIYQMFHRRTPVDISTWCVAPNVLREQPIESGHTGCGGRLDLVIRFAGHSLIIVEVKKGNADDADTFKHAGYTKWIEQQPEQDKHSVVLVTEADQEAYLGFTPVFWSDICVFLRRFVADKGDKRNHTVVALMLAFASAVEQNLLGMNAQHVRQVAEGASMLHNAQVVDHLRASVTRGIGNG